MKREAIRLHPEVESALENGKPVVALETTIIAHGMPDPNKVRELIKINQNEEQ